MPGQRKILVTRSSMPPFEEYCDEIRELWDTHWLTNRGVKHRQLEDAIQEYLGVEHMTLFVNGHSALECVLETMELGRDGRDEVITTPFTFASTTHAIVRKGLRPVFCDIRPGDYTLDPSKIESLVTERTCAIVPVHVYGNVCDVDAIEEVAGRHGLKVVYDAAHAFGVERDGVGVGSFGDASMFSFHATKVFNTIEGGAVAHPDGVLSDRLAQWRNFGITGPEDVVYVGGNSKMNEFAAAMGICNLRHVDNEIAKRKAVAERYWELLGGVPGVKVCVPPSNVRHNYAYMPVVFDPAEFGATRDDVLDALAREGVGARKYFHPLVSDYACYAGRFDSSDTPVAREVAARVLTLPLYAGLALADVDRICGITLKVGA
ncbi:DegT/DnrJ/EryC1/StrS aminotransferase family protein [Adlercreutzia sp. ZJ473]|uniref:DegT/DnrJ/EryC1/StrS family aminotransferase n=1 Tax=Adlercreutzia sp. ZJ473 TaxID=2722822 RepID=UPI0015533F86|nr:DegT/DnrJ/EryC1/StrS family aminotransferase [Adlercreutzia sp. ZJ473]